MRIILLFAVLFSYQVKATSPSIRFFIGERQYHAWAKHCLNNCHDKYINGVRDGSIPVYTPAQPNTPLTKEKITKLLQKEYTLKIVRHPIKPKDTTVMLEVSGQGISEVDYTFDGSEITTIGLHFSGIFPHITDQQPHLIIQWKDAMKVLDEEERFCILSMVKLLYKKGESKVRIDIQKALPDYGLKMHRMIEEKLFQATFNVTLPIYSHDSLNRTMTKKDLEAKLNYEVTIQVQMDTNDMHSIVDSPIQVIFERSPNDSFSLQIYMQTMPQGGLALMAAATMYEPFAGGMIVPPQPIAFIKTEDWNKCLTTDEAALLRHVCWFAAAARIDKNHLEISEIEIPRIENPPTK
jgi:hypothetical protein